MLLALIVAIDDLQEEAGQCDQLGVWSRKEALQEAVTRLIKQNEDGQRIFHLGRNSKWWSQDCFSKPDMSSISDLNTQFFSHLQFSDDFSKSHTINHEQISFCSQLPFSQHLEATEHPYVERAEVSPSEDPAPSGLSQSLSRSADAVAACGMASAASLPRI